MSNSLIIVLILELTTLYGEKMNWKMMTNPMRVGRQSTKPKAMNRCSLFISKPNTINDSSVFTYTSLYKQSNSIKHHKRQQRIHLYQFIQTIKFNKTPQTTIKHVNTYFIWQSVGSNTGLVAELLLWDLDQVPHSQFHGTDKSMLGSSA